MNRRRCLGDRQKPLNTTNTKYHSDSRKSLLLTAQGKLKNLLGVINCGD
ncbi:hypothetical protein [Okeania sp. SIO2B3]|nr:hypothetical protein [Okeania sp. SIO2B3]NET45298.1 hypothetical protein [Okeania sp. SIO2B3]